MLRIVSLVAFLTIVAPMTSGCAVALWAGTMAVGAKMDQRQKEQKQSQEPIAPAEKGE